MDIKQIASLANLQLSPEQEQLFSSQLTDTLKNISIINELDTQNVIPTSQVTGLENITRPDVIDRTRVLNQEQAISQARRSHRGYIVVPSVIWYEIKPTIYFGS